MVNPQAEYIEDGYVKISRRVFGSKTFSSLNAIQKLVTFYLILMANHQDNKWWDNHEKKFIDIKRGSFITSVEQIRKKINDRLVTPKKIRLILSTLKKMKFLAIKTTNKYTLVTILKYNLYQNGSNYEGKQKGELRASKGQGKGKQRATNNNDNKVNNGNNEKESKEIQEVRKAISASFKNIPGKEKTKPNNIEFDFEGLSWHGVDDDIVADWEKRFPDINIGEQLMKIREYFKINPDKEKYIKNYAIYINDWLTRAEKYRIADKG